RTRIHADELVPPSTPRSAARMAAAAARLARRARPACGALAVAAAGAPGVVGVGVPDARIRRRRLRLQRDLGVAHAAVVPAVHPALPADDRAVTAPRLCLRAGAGGVVLRAAALVPVGPELLRV